MKSVLISYHILPHYRRAIFNALAGSRDFRYVFCADEKEYQGIKTIKREELPEFVVAPFHEFKGIGWQPVLVREALFGNYDAYFLLSNPNFISTWLAAIIARLRGKKVLYWTHGWLKKESPLKVFVRNTFHRLAHKVLVYGERAKMLGAASGFPDDDIVVIYNSLDYDKANATFARIEAMPEAERLDAHSFFAGNPNPVMICTARLTPLCRFDLLFEAAEILASDATPINILLVGDGPSRAELEAMAASKKLPVHFFGACYDEDIIGQLIYTSDATVSPGKIGLTVIHSLSYGTPAITHGDMDKQMPEVEAIKEGLTGAFFEHDNARDLAATIKAWLASGQDRVVTRQACRLEIADKWNPQSQLARIEASLDELLN